jgi:hypothetical protein
MSFQAIADEIEFSERVVAFIDILGFGSLVRRMQTDADLRRDVYTALRRTLGKEQGLSAMQDRQVEMTSFPDCTVLSSPAGNEREILAKAAYLTRDFLFSGILCRGAIVTGPAYHRDRILLGPAVVDAYERERGVAKFPRIVVSDDVAARARERDTQPDAIVKWSRVLRRDVDGCWFVDPFHFSVKDTAAEVEDDAIGLAQPFKRFRSTLAAALTPPYGRTMPT